MSHLDKLPEYCFALLNTSNTVVLVKKGELGYFPYYEGTYKGQETVDRLNEEIGVDKIQATAMSFGSLCGWDSSASDVNSYELVDGKVIAKKPKGN